MKIYVAGGSSDLETCELWMGRLRSAGHEIALDWCANVRAVGDGNPRDVSDEDRERWSREDLDAARLCDLFWLLVPSKPSVGCWIEFGVLLGNMKPPMTVISGDHRKTIFSSLAGICFDAHEQAFEWIRVHQ